MAVESRNADGAADTTIAALAASVARHGTRTAIVDGETALTYAALQEQVDRAALALLALGVEAGDRVAIWSANNWRWIVSGLAIHSVGAAIVPLNTRYRKAELSFILGKMRPRLIFMQSGFLDADFVEILLDAVPSENRPIAVALDDSVTKNAFWTCTGWDDFMERANADGPRTAELAERKLGVTAETVSDIMFTSGTTGLPRGVVGSHGQSVKVFRTQGEIVGVTEEDRYAIVGPFSHSFGYKSGWLLSLIFGAAAYPVAKLDAPELARLIQDARITLLPGPIAIHQSLLALPDLAKFDLGSLSKCYTGGSTLHRSVLEEVRERLGFKTLLSSYGLTECTAFATSCRRGDDLDTIGQTAGRAIPGVEIAIVDPNGAHLPSGQAGEVMIRGYNVMSEYFEDPAATREAISQDGWLRTGDLGSLDERGYLRITGRLKDMFIVGGFNAYPAEIEAVLLDHPDIVEVAVLGVPDGRLGEVGLAFVVPATDARLDEAAVIAWARERMANYKVPRRLLPIDALPRNATGKVVKQDLLARASALTESDRRP